MLEKSIPGCPLIRIALVEDDVDVQMALTAVLANAPDMTVAGVASTRAQGLVLLEQAQVDVLLVDLGLPDGSGIDVIRAAHARWPGCNIMVSTIFGDEAHVMQSIKAGASGYLLKDSPAEEMLAEIRSLHAGGSPISPLIARQILTRFRQPDHAAAVPAATCNADKPDIALSSRESEVLEYIAKGFTSTEIAALMSVSLHTVQTYVRRIYKKLEVSSKTEAIHEARLHGLLA
jgi:DNA-binding NarL/FixJ family response regulator